MVTTKNVKEHKHCSFQRASAPHDPDRGSEATDNEGSLVVQTQILRELIHVNSRLDVVEGKLLEQPSYSQRKHQVCKLGTSKSRLSVSKTSKYCNNGLSIGFSSDVSCKVQKLDLKLC